MGDIELVIKIPENTYEVYKALMLSGGPGLNTVVKSIANATPLPKGHGRLIDADALMRELSVVSSRPVKSQLYIINEAQTIIEADNTESENKYGDKC